ncbi:hypothetical protein BSNK01_08060 [Bacillaceae bacterium]
MTKFIEFFNKLVLRISVILLIALCVISALQVFFRYVLNNSLSWSEELSRFIFVWITFLGAALAVKEKMHVRFDLLTNSLGYRVRRYFYLFIDLLISIFLIVLCVQGVQFSLRALKNNLISPAMQLPLEVVYSIVAIGALVMLINHLYVTWKDFYGYHD